MNNGKFPDECPNCNKSDNLEYGDFDYDSSSEKLSQTITCNGCNSVFKEFFKPFGWESQNS